MFAMNLLPKLMRNTPTDSHTHLHTLLNADKLLPQLQQIEQVYYKIPQGQKLITQSLFMLFRSYSGVFFIVVFQTV